MRRDREHPVLRRILLPLLCAALLLPVFPRAARAAKTVSEIRVLLTRPRLTDEAWMTLDGRYLARCADGREVLLPAGAKISVFLREGGLVLFHEGLAFSAGKSLSLLRRQDGDTEPGIRFNLRDGICPGDLSLTVNDGAIRAVLTLPLETYLLGVVPYEMSEAFPLEALKAQAVCARTYALSKAGSSAEWDVTDNTNDQVFNGVPSSCENTALAVAETEGLVLTYKGKLITAWYSASNGGQTELPGNIWSGKNAPACFAMTDDPWDLENPGSTLRTAVLNRDGSGFPAGILRLVRETLAADPAWNAWRLSAEDTLRVDAVRSVQVSAPRYAAPSRLMTRLELGLDVSAALKDGGPDLVPAGACDVTLDLFPEAVYLLGLSVCGTDNEIVSVSEDETAFTLTAGRYGHGVGMSQRGAQYQASKGEKTFRQILAFYYPGAELKRYAGEPAPVPTADPLLGVTPGPVPTATPRPTLMPVTEELPEGAWLASVENIADGSTLNLREKPSAGAKILMKLYKHQQLIVLEESEVAGWMHVKTDVIEGYVMYSFLQKTE